MKNLKRLLSLLLVTAMVLPVNQKAYASETLLYEKKEIETITDGLTYEKSTRLYDRGWMDVYVLTIDIGNPNVKLDTLQNYDQYGLKHSVEYFANQSGALAAINGDFFGTGSPQSSMGTVIKDGSIESTRNYYNSNANTYAGLFVDAGRTPFIDYLKISYIGFFGANTARIELEAKNKISNSFYQSLYFDRSALTSTATLDSKVANLSKIVVDNGVITYISAPGEVVNVPENGYVIVVPKRVADVDLEYFHVGDEAVYSESYRFSGIPDKPISSVVFGLTGGSKILEQGTTVAGGLIIDVYGRQPRTVVGIDKDKTKIMLIAVDGRGKSIGANHYECAEILREYGAWDAFHLDGGGSTTLVAAGQGDTNLTVKNTVSEGSQRQVANALGVFSTNAPGPLAGMYISVNGNSDNVQMLASRGYTVSAKGHDANKNAVNAGAVSYSVKGIEGTFNGNTFIPSAPGQGQIVATSAGVSSELDVTVLAAPTALRLNPSGISMKNNETVKITGRMVNEDGYGMAIDPSVIHWSVDPVIGMFDGSGNFTATTNGKAVITATYGNIKGQVSVAVGSTAATVESFENDDNIFFTKYPSAVSGSFAYSTSQAKDGLRSAALTYTFMPGTATGQSASIDFSQAQNAAIDGSPLGMGLWVKGDGSGYDIKMNMKDANGEVFNLDFKTPLTFTDWRYVYAAIPSGVSYPVKLDKIYVIAPQTGAVTTTNTVLVDLVQAEYPISPESEIARTGGVADPMRQDLSGLGNTDDTVVSVFGPTAWKNTALDNVVFQDAVTKMQQNADLAMFAGYTGVPQTLSIPTIKWMDKYEQNGLGNVRTINLATSKSSLRLTEAAQLKSLQSDLYNTGKKNTIIMMNKDIWDTSNGFSDSKERDIFHDILKQYHERTGANVIVVAGCSYMTKVNVVDGIRYITLNGLLSTTYDIENDYTILKIKASEDGMVYDFQDVYQSTAAPAPVPVNEAVDVPQPVDDVPFVD